METNRTNVTILVGGYRKKNTWEMAKAYQKGAEAAGHQVRFLHLRDYKILPCTGCEYCFNTGQCILKDEMEVIYDAINWSDTIVLASPLYFYSLTSDMKQVIDRAQPYWSDKFVRKMEKKKDKLICILLSCHGGKFEHDAFYATYKPVRTFCGSLHAEYRANYLLSSTDRNPVMDRIDVLEEIAEWGSLAHKLPKITIHR